MVATATDRAGHVKNVLQELSQDVHLLTVKSFMPVLANIMTEAANLTDISNEDKKLVVLDVLTALAKRAPFPENEILPPLLELAPAAIDLLIATGKKYIHFTPGKYFHWPTQTTKPIPVKVSEKSGRRFTLRAQQPDSRDLVYKAPHTVLNNLPSKVDLRPHMPPALDQGELGSCGSSATSNALRYLLRKEKQPEYQPSRLLIYYQTRVNIEGSPPSEDTGVQIRDLCKALKNYGAADETYWKYDITTFAGPPPKVALDNQKLHRQLKFQSVPQNLATIQACLADGFPILIGFQVFDSFEGDDVARTGKMPMPNADKENCLGGHAVLVVGYDSSKKLFLVQNSWGGEWGENGFFYMPYEYLLNADLASDFWAISLFE